MLSKKPFLILQLRPEDITSDNEFDSILKYAELTPEEVQRIRIEETGIPEISLDDYSAIIVGGSPFDISTASEDKSEIQKKIEADFKLLFDKILAIDFPFLGACSGNGL
ncbi:MAG: glutamine amidotransferase, partial [Gammaproteobacteria bacterium]|nr:glutamine amidotransferase [Gammaproteobacteria bacterium]